MAKNGTTNFIKEYWFVILAVVSIVASYTTLGLNIKNCDQKLNDHITWDNNSTEKYQDLVTECQAEIREMKRDISYVSDSAKKAEKNTEEILKELREQ